jgi:hypothetical protein
MLEVIANRIRALAIVVAAVGLVMTAALVWMTLTVRCPCTGASTRAADEPARAGAVAQRA